MIIWMMLNGFGRKKRKELRDTERGGLILVKKPIRSSQFSDCRTCPHRKDVEYCMNFCKKGDF